MSNAHDEQVHIGQKERGFWKNGTSDHKRRYQYIFDGKKK